MAALISAIWSRSLWEGEVKARVGKERKDDKRREEVWEEHEKAMVGKEKEDDKRREEVWEEA